MEAAKRIKLAVYVVDTTIRNLDRVVVINRIFGHQCCPPNLDGSISTS